MDEPAIGRLFRLIHARLPSLNRFRRHTYSMGLCSTAAPLFITCSMKDVVLAVEAVLLLTFYIAAKYQL